MPDLRKKFKPLKGGEGFVALESAFIKYEHGKVDRLLAEGGYEDYVFSVLAGEYAKVEAFYPKKSGESLSQLDEDKKRELDSLLENFDPNTQVITLGSKRLQAIKNKVLRTFGKVIGFTPYKGIKNNFLFITNHVYAIAEVDSEQQTIIIVNPWDVSKPVTLSFEDIKNDFSSLTVATFDGVKLVEALDVARRDYKIK